MVKYNRMKLYEIVASLIVEAYQIDDNVFQK